ncbi:MAG TPA: amidase family protein, partial [Baekduia sp.]
RNSFPAEDSGVAKKLREHGVVILGKAGLSEWANSFGSNPSGFGNLTGQVLNAIDADQNPSGSSSGSAAAASAALSMLTIGTETSGSIISPSSTQGVVGLRPTVGLVPGYGIAPIDASQDTAGPIVRTVSDAAMTLQSIAGPDPEGDQEYDDIFGPDYLSTGVIPTPPAEVPDYMSALDTHFVQGKRIGYNGTLTPGSALQAAYDALTAAGAIMVSDPVTTVASIPALPSGYEQHKTIDEYYAHLGPDVPIKSLAEEVADNQANAQESLKFGNSAHLSESLADISAGGANETQYRTNLIVRKAAYHQAIDSMLNMGTPNDPTDDVIAVLGSVPSGPQAGYPQITIPMGYNATTRRTVNVSVNGGAYDERTLIGVGYVIEQATHLRKPASEVDPSMYRCAKTVPAAPFSDRGGCNPDYDTIMAKVGTAPDLGFSLETTSIKSLDSKLDAGSLTSEQLVKAYLARIALTNAEGPATQAVRSVNLDAIAEAKALDDERGAFGARGPLHGIPVLVDDSFDVDGTPTTAGSIALQHSVPTQDSKVVAQLKAAGAIILGKTNVTELNGLFDTNIPEGYSSLGGQVLVPSDTDKTPGGSSAGSAASTASGLAAATVGLETSTDTAQLIGPAAVNGVVGLKPTVGLVGRTGVLGVAKSQDSPGPIARTVYDAAAELQAMAGHDPDDSATAGAPIPTDYLAGLTATALSGKKVAVVTGVGATAAPYPSAVTTVTGLGASTTVGVDVPTTSPQTLPTPTVNPPSIVSREFKRDLNAYLATGHAGGASTLQGIIDYNIANPEEGLKYQQGELTAAQAVDLTDSATETAYEGDRDTGKDGARDYLDNILDAGTPGDTTDDPDVIMVPGGNATGAALVGIADRAGYPVLTVPAGYGTGSAGRNPIGITFIGGAYSEAELLADGYAFEQATKVRQAPSFTNPSMWRCVPQSTFFSPHECNPGDRAYTAQFSPIPPPQEDQPDTPVDPTPPVGPGPAPAPTPAPAPALPLLPKPAPPAAKAFKVGSATAGSTHKSVQVTVQLPGGGTVTGTATASSKVKGKVKKVTLGRVSVKHKAGGTSHLTIRFSAAGMRALKAAKVLKVTIRVTFTPPGGKARVITKTVTVKSH